MRERKKIQVICPCCGNIALKVEAEVKRQIKNNQNVYCSKQCAFKGSSEIRTVHTETERECLYCLQKFKSSSHKKARRCCSSTCATKYSKSFVDSSKISSSLKEYYRVNVHPNTNKKIPFTSRKTKHFHRRDENGLYNSECVSCGTSFKTKTGSRKTCSVECHHNRLSDKCGGETNYKKFQYKEIWMDSSWEVDLAKWFDENQIEWIRDKKINFVWIDTNQVSHRYYPDFYLPKYNVYIDPKNKFLQKKDKEKLDYVREHGKVTLLTGLIEDIKQELERFK